MTDLHQAFIKAYEKAHPSVPGSPGLRLHSQEPHTPGARGLGSRTVEPAVSTVATGHAFSADGTLQAAGPGTVLTSDELHWLGVTMPSATKQAAAAIASQPSTNQANGSQANAPPATEAEQVRRWTAETAKGIAAPHFDLARFFRPTLVVAEGTLQQAAAQDAPPSATALAEPSAPAARSIPPRFESADVETLSFNPSPRPANIEVLATLPIERELATPAEPTTGRLIESTPEPALPGPLRAVWQVERFAWPETCERLSSAAASELSRLGATLLQGADRGQQTLIVSSARSGEGRTTAVLALARQLATQGIRLLVIDGDFLRPAIADQLALSIEVGLKDWLNGSQPLEEVLIEAIEDNLTLLPLVEPLGENFFQNNTTSGRAAERDAAWQRLRQEFDLILIDSPALDDFSSDKVAGSLLQWFRPDATILVHDTTATSSVEMEAAARRIERAGIPLLGIIQNHVVG